MTGTLQWGKGKKEREPVSLVSAEYGEGSPEIKNNDV